MHVLLFFYLSILIFYNCKWYCIFNFSVHVLIVGIWICNWFVILFSYPEIMLNSFISSKILLLFLDAMEFLCSQLCHMQIRTVLHSFPICIPFILFYCLIALTRISSTMLNKSEKDRNSCFIPYLKGKSLSFIINHDVSCRFLVHVYY